MILDFRFPIADFGLRNAACTGRRDRQNSQVTIVLILLCLLLLSACGGGAVVASGEAMTPTLHPFFVGSGGTAPPDAAPPGAAPPGAAPPTISALFATIPTATPKPLPTRRPTSTPTVTPLPSPTLEPGVTPTVEVTPVSVAALPRDGRFREIIIFDDELDPNWTLGESWGISYTLTQTAVVYTGTLAAAVTPQEEFGALFLTIRPDTLQEYLREEVLGVSLWLNSGDDYLPLDEMAVTILGSNAYPYWVENDDSVELVEGESFFSETRLYYLELNQEIPPHTWVEVIIWLDQLPYDPDYLYITGIYVKNGDVFQGTYYVDRVSLLFGGES